jgi:hypothetical protein
LPSQDEVNSVDDKHFKMSGRQWQCRRRLPQRLADSIGQTWFIKNLGTDSLSKAIRLRNRFNVDLADLEAALQSSGGMIKDGLTLGKQIGPEVCELVCINPSSIVGLAAKPKVGERVGSPIDMHLRQWQRQFPVVETTQKARGAALGRFLNWSLADHIHQIDRRLAGRYVDKLVEEGLAEMSVNSRITHLSGYWRYLVRKGIVEGNPWRQQSLGGRIKQQRLAWTMDEVRLLHKRAPTDLLHHAIATLALMGLRSSELTSLKVSHIVNGVCDIRVGKTESARRILPWHRRLSDIVSNRLQEKGPDEFLFHELRGNPNMPICLTPAFAILSRQFSKLRAR